MKHALNYCTPSTRAKPEPLSELECPYRRQERARRRESFLISAAVVAFILVLVVIIIEVCLNTRSFEETPKMSPNTNAYPAPTFTPPS